MWEMWDKWDWLASPVTFLRNRAHNCFDFIEKRIYYKFGCSRLNVSQTAVRQDPKLKSQ